MRGVACARGLFSGSTDRRIQLIFENNDCEDSTMKYSTMKYNRNNFEKEGTIDSSSSDSESESGSDIESDSDSEHDNEISKKKYARLVRKHASKRGINQERAKRVASRKNKHSKGNAISLCTARRIHLLADNKIFACFSSYLQQQEVRKRYRRGVGRGVRR
jgi:hypothetical protein